jgi:hypothetical protein
MFLAECTRCGRRELRGPRALVGLTNRSTGIELRFRCSQCGTVQRTVTGAHASLPMRQAG